MNLNPVIFMANRVVKTVVPATFKIFLFYQESFILIAFMTT